MTKGQKCLCAPVPLSLPSEEQTIVYSLVIDECFYSTMKVHRAEQ